MMAPSGKRSVTPLAIDSPGERGRAVREMFSAIAPRYDLLNHLLSLNIDRIWRRRCVDRLDWQSRPDGRYLDLCAGTLDLALELAGRDGFTGRVIAVDFSRAMLRAGRRKVGGRPVIAVCSDALLAPFASQSFDGALVAFGVRNLVDIDAGLREVVRLLRPGARLTILDFSLPAGRLGARLYGFYFTRLLPLIGQIVSKHSFAYNYLPESVASFDGPDVLAERMGSAGLRGVAWQRLSGGIACVWWGTRPDRLDASDAG